MPDFQEAALLLAMFTMIVGLVGAMAYRAGQYSKVGQLIDGLLVSRSKELVLEEENDPAEPDAEIETFESP